MADKRPPINAIRGTTRKAQYDARIDYETNGGDEAEEKPFAPASDEENDRKYAAARKAREVAVATPDKSTRVDPVGALRNKVTDLMVNVHNRFSKNKID